MYQALYRKYRPKKFEEVFGQPNIVETIKNAIIHNKLSHAYLFSGPRGTGKTSIAKIIAHTINCQNLDGIKVCDNCVSCTQKDTDVIEIDAASNNGVDEIRELKNKITLVPTYGKYKVYIIDEVHMLTISAFNALLKTLEEPPKHVIFILATTDPQKLPSTILSRCQHFDFKRIDENSIQERLNFICTQENIKIESNALREISRIAEGGLRDAINILDQAYSYTDDTIDIDTIHDINGTISQYEIETFYKLFIENKLDSILKKINEYNEKGKNLVKLTQEFVMYLRNILIYQKCKQYLIENNIDYKPYEKIANTFTQNKVLELIKDFNYTITEMKISSNPKLNLELFFIKNIEPVDNQVKECKEFPLEKKAKVKSSETEEPERAMKINKEIHEVTEDFSKKRIENTLARFDKTILKKLQSEINKIKPLLVNQKYSQIVSLILDGSIRAASERNIIFMFKLSSDVDLFHDNLNMIEEIIEKSLGINYKVIAVNSEKWEIIKSEFNQKKKEYIYIEEPEENIKPLEKKDSILQNFEDIIEYR